MNGWDIGGIFIALGCAVVVYLLISGYEPVIWKDEDE